MTPDWSPLQDELDRWRDAGLTLPLWWRDDDAVEPDPRLDRLVGLSRSIGLPVHLAIIPARATPELAGLVRRSDGVCALVHGWAHRNHARVGIKKSEFGEDRDPALALRDAARGLAVMRTGFGPDLVPVFVPPWNRICAPLVAGLAGIGYRAISAFGPRPKVHAAPDLVAINTHLDPIDWRGGRSLAAPPVLIARLCRLLADRRTGVADAGEPLGLLTHHLVHDAAIWTFCEELLGRLLDGPAAPWTAFATDREGD